MNIYGSQIWKFYNKEVHIFILHGENKFDKYIHNYNRTHNILINHIIQCYHIDIILGKSLYSGDYFIVSIFCLITSIRFHCLTCPPLYVNMLIFLYK